MKALLFSLFSIILALNCTAQDKTETLLTNWPPEYAWKIVQRHNGSTKSDIIIIPGNETTATASIIGVISAFQGLDFLSPDSIVAYYRNQLDQGSLLTVLDKSHDAKLIWALFKVETPKTTKYPDPESDLYYVAQGRFALYDTHVAIKQAFLSPPFLTKWSEILKNSKIAMQ